MCGKRHERRLNSSVVFCRSLAVHSRLRPRAVITENTLCVRAECMRLSMCERQVVCCFVQTCCAMPPFFMHSCFLFLLSYTHASLLSSAMNQLNSSLPYFLSGDTQLHIHIHTDGQTDRHRRRGN
jgi:hypothetical protein